MYRRFDEARSASHVNLLSSGSVVCTQRLAAVASVRGKDSHGVLQACIARWLRAARELHAERQVVNVTARWRGGVGNGVCETVIAIGVGQTASMVQRLVRNEAIVCLRHHRISHRQIRTAVVLRLYLLSQAGHKRGASGKFDVASCVERLCKADKGTCCCEKAIGGLVQQMISIAQSTQLRPK